MPYEHVNWDKTVVKKRKTGFLPYFEPFRTPNEKEIKSIVRLKSRTTNFVMVLSNEFQVSYQALTGGFTICNIIVNGQLYSGSSHCSKTDQWLPIRGQMLAFKRALESTGIDLPIAPEDNDKEDDSEVHDSDSDDLPF